MKTKTILVLLDGLDYEFIREHADELPFFRRLMEQGCLQRLPSVIPADSIPSWTTIYTGLNPAEHGVLESIDYLDFKNKVNADSSVIQGRTFWDVLSRQGKKVFVFNPFMAYPAWDVNGLMICGPVFEGGDVSVNHPEQVDLKGLPAVGGMVDHPTNKEMPDFFRNTMELSQRQFDAFHQYFRRQPYDFAFLGITTPDRMQHFLWRYTDPEDRTYPGKTELQDSILRMYQLMEKNVERILREYGGEYNVAVISDHGHGRRCQQVFYINQWLIENGFIPERSRKKRAVEYAKNATLAALTRVHRVQAGTDFFKRFKVFHKVKNADHVFRAKGAVYAPKFDGVNPYGGISVKRECFSSDAEYEKMRQRIIDGLQAVRHDGKPVMRWVKRREEIYQGAKVENYPEIVYWMESDYGVDRGLYGKRLFGISPFHEVISGGHQPGGVIMGNREDIRGVESVLDIHRYIVRISGGKEA